MSSTADLVREISSGNWAYTWDDVAPRFTCGEAEALADLFRSVGHDGMAERLLDAHCEEDDEGDQHYDRLLTLREG